MSKEVYSDQYEQESLLETHDVEQASTPDRRRPRHTWKSRLSHCLQILGTVVTGLILGNLIATQLHTSANLKSTCFALTSRPSPLNPEVPITYSTVPFNGSLLKENIYRQPGSPEVDAAWQALGVNYRAVIVPADEAERVGLAKVMVKVREKYGGGFPANVEGLHQLHCLDLIRQTVYYNYEYYRKKGEGGFKNSDFVLQKHVSHCIDIIRQQLMCTVDVGVFGQVWFQPPGQAFPEAYVDFNTKHVCRNFEDVRRWAEEHQAPEDVPDDYLKPPKEGDRIYSEIP